MEIRYTRYTAALYRCVIEDEVPGKQNRAIARWRARQAPRSGKLYQSRRANSEMGSSGSFWACRTKSRFNNYDNLT